MIGNLSEEFPLWFYLDEFPHDTLNLKLKLSVACLFDCLFCFLINTALKLIIMGLPGEWKEHESFKERNMNVVE